MVYVSFYRDEAVGSQLINIAVVSVNCYQKNENNAISLDTQKV